MSRKPVYRRGEVITVEDCDMLLAKGNLTAEEFGDVERNYGYGVSDAASIKRGWMRCEQQGDNRGYDFTLQPTAPHARGAFEATWVEW